MVTLLVVTSVTGAIHYQIVGEVFTAFPVVTFVGSLLSGATLASSFNGGHLAGGCLAAGAFGNHLAGGSYTFLVSSSWLLRILAVCRLVFRTCVLEAFLQVLGTLQFAGFLLIGFCELQAG